MKTNILFSLLLVLSACQQENTGNDTKPQFSLIGDSSLYGGWENNCVSSEDDDYSLQIAFSAGGYFSKSRNTFIEAGCNTLGHVTNVNGEYVFSEVAEHEGKISFKIKEVSITARHQDVVSLFNEIKFCDLNNWEMNNTKVFSDGVCGVAKGYDTIQAGISVVGDGLKIMVDDDEANEQFSNEIYRRTKVAH